MLGELTVSERDERNQLVISGKWFDNLVALGGGNYFDIINYHAYVDSWRMDEKYNCLMEVVNKYPVLQDKKIWLTETGASSYVSGTSEEQNIVTDESIKTEFIEQTYAQHKRYDNIERIFIYTFTNPTNNTDKENNFGLATYDGQPFDAYYHFQALGGAQLDFSAEQNETWQTLTYDAADVDGDTVRITDDQLQLDGGASLGLRLNDQWVYDADGVLEAQQAYVDVDYPAGQKGAKWQIVYDGQAGTGMESAVFTIPDDKAGTGTVLLESIKFANGLDGDDLRLRAVDGPLTASGVTVRKMAGRAVCILGETNQNISMKLVSESNESGNGYTMPATIGGKECRKIGGDKKWFYFIVAHGVARAGDTHVTVEIEYYDQGTDALVLAYNNPNKKVTIQKTGTNTWKTARIELTDADFAKNQSYGGDFHIENGGDGSAEYVHSVIVTCHPDYAVLSGFEQVGGSEVGVVTFQNQYDDQPKRAAAAMGLFEDGRLVDIQYQDITVPPGKQSHTVLLQPETERQEGQQWKLFVWDDKMQPLTEPAVSG